MSPDKNILHPALAANFSGIIWKLKTDESGIIAVETRDTSKKEVRFSAFSFITGETYFKEHIYEERWNLSLAFTTENNLVINSFEHAETPESKGIISVNLKDGSVLWQKFNISLNLPQHNGLQVYDSRMQPRKYYWIEHLTGRNMAAPSIQPEDHGILFPEADKSFTIPHFIQHAPLAGDLSVLQYSDKVFLSFHELMDDHLRQRLLVYQGDKVLLDDILISGIQKLQPEAFFIQQNHLIFIRNKGEIISYLL
jgi:hypothetical protein